MEASTSLLGLDSSQGLPFRFFTESRQLPETKFRPKFCKISLIPNEKRNQIQKTKFRWIPTEISVIFHRKMVSVVIFLLFRRSNEKLLNTNFVQFFEIYNFCFRNFFIWAMVWKLFNYFKNYQLKVLSFHVTTFIFSLRPQLDFYYSCYGGYSYKFLGTLVDPIESCFKSRTNMIWIGYQFMWQCLNFLFDSICIENC